MESLALPVNTRRRVSSDPDLSGVVLAGGGSRRMGHPKHQIRLNGETLLERQLGILRHAGASALWISLRSHQEPAVETVSAERMVRRVHDAEPGLGPLAGLSAVLNAAETTWILVLAVDLPAMTPDFLRTLLARRQGHAGVVPHLSGRHEPLAALYPRTMAPLLQERLKRRDLRLQPMIQDAIALGHLVSVTVAPADEPLFANWNRPEDLPPEARLTG